MYESSDNMKKILCIILCLFINISLVSASKIDYINTKTAAVEVAMSYYRKNSNIGYDSFRKRLYASSEEASSQNTIYTVNSAFIYQVYYQTLGIKLATSTKSLIKYAKENYNSKYNSNKKYIIESLSKNEINNIYKDNYIKSLTKKIEVGDILVIQKENGIGDSLMVKEVNKTDNKITLIGATGIMYNFNTHTEYSEDSGAIKLINLENILTKDITDLAIIRIIHDDSTYINNSGKKVSYKLTDSAKSRLEYKGISITKTSTKPNTTYVSENEEITYTIEIKNNSNFVYKNLKIVEYISPYVSIVDASDGKVVASKIIWTKNIGANKSIKIKYKVKTNNNSLGKYILSKGYVASIKNATIVNKVGISLTSSDKEKLKNTYNKLLNTSKKVEASFISQVYKEALGIDISYLDNKDMYNLVRLKNNSIVINNDLKKMIVGNYYGLRIAKNASLEKQVVSYHNAWDMYSKYEILDRARYLNYNMLEVGDIIFVYTETNNSLVSKAYLYLGDGVLGRKYDTELSVKHSNSGTIYSNNTNGMAKTNNMLSNLIGDNYIVIRPILANSNIVANNIKDITKIYNDIEDLSLLPNNILNDNNYDLNKVLKDNTTIIEKVNGNKYLIIIGSLLVIAGGITFYTLKHSKF